MQKACEQLAAFTHRLEHNWALFLHAGVLLGSVAGKSAPGTVTETRRTRCAKAHAARAWACDLLGLLGSMIIR